MRKLKLLVLRTGDRLGLSRTILSSSWRQQRLLILCYHGTSLEDEHLWSGGLYIPQETLRERLEILKQKRCNVLDLGEAVKRLYSGDLPPRSVAITYDDGNYDFYARAFPVIRNYGFPVTVYWTTYYAEYNRPVFDVMCSYLLWKRRGTLLRFPDIGLSSVLLDDAGQDHARRAMIAWAGRENLSAREKDGLMSRLAGSLGIDYEALCARRVLCIMTPSEAKELASAGVDFQLHTHRHRTSTDSRLFRRELDDNRRRIEAVTPRPVEHFCYPGGFHLPSFPDWLRDYGIASATTCQPGICTRDTDAMLMPRLLDTTGLSSTEFGAWVSGVAALLPRRKHAHAEGQLLESVDIAAASPSSSSDAVR
jgi:peptidoglycan/xylan/chitin deacetylase (PgdA/CDA1 family)